VLLEIEQFLAGSVAQVTECLHSKYKPLSSNPSTTNKKKKVGRKEGSKEGREGEREGRKNRAGIQ
jgi:hypothetical protein